MKDMIQAVKDNLEITSGQTLSDSIYEALKKTIILAQIPAGTRINEMEVAQALNTSRTPIRSALDKLAEENLVKKVQGVGTIVIGINQKDAHEIYDIRKALDTLATIRAMENMSDEDFVTLEDSLKRGDYFNENELIDDLMDNFEEFNGLIYEFADMPRLQEIIRQLKSYLSYFRDISIRASQRRTLALEEHWLIYRGMKNRDPEQITMIQYEHLDRSLDFVLNEMKKYGIE